MSFYVIRCKNCGRWSSREVRKSIRETKFKCNFCNKSKVVKSKKSLHAQLQYVGPYSGIDAAAVCAIKNKGSQ